MMQGVDVGREEEEDGKMGSWWRRLYGKEKEEREINLNEGN